MLIPHVSHNFENFYSSFVTAIPSTWGFILACILLRVAEGAGTAMFCTATYSSLPKLFPNSVSFLMVIEIILILTGTKEVNSITIRPGNYR